MLSSSIIFAVDDHSRGLHACSVYRDAEEAKRNLSRELSPVAHRWLHIGVLLGIKLWWLEQRRSGDAQQNLRDMLYRLISHHSVTLQRLVEAVEHRAGGNNPELAQELKSKLIVV